LVILMTFQCAFAVETIYDSLVMFLLLFFV
jgi:hypothetical protein